MLTCTELFPDKIYSIMFAFWNLDNCYCILKAELKCSSIACKSLFFIQKVKYLAGGDDIDWHRDS